MKVKFTHVEDFLDELTEDRGQVEDGILRVTFLFQQDKALPPIVHLTVYAGCVIRGRVVELKHYVGDTWEKPEQGDKTRARAEEIRNKILLAAHSELNLDVRSGVFES